MTRKLANTYRSDRVPDQLDAVVIGSGMAGLSAASCLAQQGLRVLVLERHGVPGGMTHSFRRKSYHWDVGLHYVGRMLGGDPVGRAMRHVTGDRVEWLPLPDDYDHVEFPGRSFSFVRGRQPLMTRLLEAFPGERGAIAQYFALLDRAGRSMTMKVLGQTLSKYLGPGFGRLADWPLRKLASSTTDTVLRRLTDNAQLRSVLCGQWGNYGLPPEQSSFAAHALVARHYLEGGAYPKGGSAALAQAMVPIIEEAGGRVLVRADVERIIVEKHGRRERAVGVQMQDGQVIHAPHVISAAGAWATHHKLLRDHPRLGPDCIEESKLATAHYALFIGARGGTEELGLTAANIWMYPGGDHDENLRRYRADPSADFPLMFVSSSSAKDASDPLHRLGKSTVEAIVPADFADVEAWKQSRWKRRGTAYESHKSQLSDRILQRLLQRFPQLEGAIEWCELSTPLTTNHFCATRRGELYGMGASPQRFLEPSSAQGHGVQGLEISGQDSLLFGVSGAMFSGILSAHRIAGLPVLRSAFVPRRSPIELEREEFAALNPSPAGANGNLQLVKS